MEHQLPQPCPSTTPPTPGPRILSPRRSLTGRRTQHCTSALVSLQAMPNSSGWLRVSGGTFTWGQGYHLSVPKLPHPCPLNEEQHVTLVQHFTVCSSSAESHRKSPGIQCSFHVERTGEMEQFAPESPKGSCFSNWDSYLSLFSTNLVGK